MNLTLLPRFRALALFASSIILALSASAQVDFSLSLSEAASLKEKSPHTAKLTVRLDPGWHISSLTTPDGGPIRTEIALPKSSPFKLAGKIKAPEPRKQHSEAFGVDVETYEREVEFTLLLEATKDIPPGTKLVVEVTFQACTEDSCLMPKTEKVEAEIAAKPAKSSK